jgi:hypothetical protein
MQLLNFWVDRFNVFFNCCFMDKTASGLGNQSIQNNYSHIIIPFSNILPDTPVMGTGMRGSQQNTHTKGDDCDRVLKAITKASMELCFSNSMISDQLKALENTGLDAFHRNG